MTAVGLLLVQLTVVLCCVAQPTVQGTAYESSSGQADQQQQQQQVTATWYLLLSVPAHSLTSLLLPCPPPQVCVLGDVKHCEQAQAIGIDSRSVEDLKKLNKNKKLVKKLGEAQSWAHSRPADAAAYSAQQQRSSGSRVGLSTALYCTPGSQDCMLDWHTPGCSSHVNT